MSSLLFVPRKLAKGVKSQVSRPPVAQTNVLKHSTITSSSSTPSSSTPSSLVNTTQAAPIVEPASKYDDQDYANLIALCLSDYSLWLDTELRQKAGIGSQPTSSQNSGYISLNYLLRHSTALRSIWDSESGKALHMVSSKVQGAIVKGVRAYASHFLDVRLLLHPDKTVPFFGEEKDVAGGYEVRRKRVGLVMRGKHDWDSCTLYLENIPPIFRSYAQIIRFLSHLLHDGPSLPSSSMLTSDPLTRIQGITFPPHHNDKPITRPSCRGFALVTFAQSTDCECLKEHWPWFRETQVDIDTNQIKVTAENKPNSPSVEAFRLARQHNFRIITKERWLQLKAEYLTYRNQIVEMMNVHQDSRPTQPRKFQDIEQSVPDTVVSTDTRLSPPLPASHSLTLDPTVPYPPNCLAFVKNIHPETTKTTIRSLLFQALPSKSAQPSQKNCEGLDYVDFSKGMDTCYLRLATPAHTMALVNYFDHQNRQVVQASGIDETGIDLASGASLSCSDLKPLVVNCVTGKPEELYWDKVPVKIRRAAVEKAIKLMRDQRDCIGQVSIGRKRVRDTDEAFLKKKKGKP